MVTNNDGVNQIKNIKPYNYIIQYSFVGMKTIKEAITIPGKNGSDLGAKVMEN